MGKDKQYSKLDVTRGGDCFARIEHDTDGPVNVNYSRQLTTEEVYFVMAHQCAVSEGRVVTLPLIAFDRDDLIIQASINQHKVLVDRQGTPFEQMFYELLSDMASVWDRHWPEDWQTKFLKAFQTRYFHRQIISIAANAVCEHFSEREVIEEEAFLWSQVHSGKLDLPPFDTPHYHDYCQAINELYFLDKSVKSLLNSEALSQLKGQIQLFSETDIDAEGGVDPIEKGCLIYRKTLARLDPLKSNQDFVSLREMQEVFCKLLAATQLDETLSSYFGIPLDVHEDKNTSFVEMMKWAVAELEREKTRVMFPMLLSSLMHDASYRTSGHWVRLDLTKTHDNNFQLTIYDNQDPGGLETIDLTDPYLVAFQSALQSIKSGARLTVQKGRCVRFASGSSCGLATIYADVSFDDMALPDDRLKKECQLRYHALKRLSELSARDIHPISIPENIISRRELEDYARKLSETARSEIKNAMDVSPRRVSRTFRDLGVDRVRHHHWKSVADITPMLSKKGKERSAPGDMGVPGAPRKPGNFSGLLLRERSTSTRSLTKRFQEASRFFKITFSAQDAEDEKRKIDTIARRLNSSFDTWQVLVSEDRQSVYFRVDEGQKGWEKNIKGEVSTILAVEDFSFNQVSRQEKAILKKALFDYQAKPQNDKGEVSILNWPEESKKRRISSFCRAGFGLSGSFMSTDTANMTTPTGSHDDADSDVEGESITEVFVIVSINTSEPAWGSDLAAACQRKYPNAVINIRKIDDPGIPEFLQFASDKSISVNALDKILARKSCEGDSCYRYLVGEEKNKFLILQALHYAIVRYINWFKTGKGFGWRTHSKKRDLEPLNKIYTLLSGVAAQAYFQTDSAQKILDTALPMIQAYLVDKKTTDHSLQMFFIRELQALEILDNDDVWTQINTWFGIDAEKKQEWLTQYDKISSITAQHHSL